MLTARQKLLNVRERGFTLLEVVIAAFIFVIIMTIVAGIFGNAFRGYRQAEAIHRDLENAQFAMNLMAKSLRTSTIISYPDTSSVKIFDYSQGRCIEYKANAAVTPSRLEMSSADLPEEEENEIAWCSGASLGAAAALTTGAVAGKFYSIPSPPDSSVAGRVIIALEVCPEAGCEEDLRDEVNIQSTVSLRNRYEEVAP